MGIQRIAYQNLVQFYSENKFLIDSLNSNIAYG